MEAADSAEQKARELFDAGDAKAQSLVQVLEKVDVTKGKLLMKISGKRKGKRKRLDRSEFSEDGEKVLKLEFANYQDVDGEIILPEDFKPEGLLIEFLPRNKELKKMSRRFSWNDHLLSPKAELSDVHE